MGYTTEFEGEISIEPPLSPIATAAVNAFCAERHGSSTNVFPGFPSFWCDWEVSEDGSKIRWNGSEKSYCMVDWLKLLVSRFFSEHVLNGEVRARGEQFSDIWTIVVKDSDVVRKEGW